MKSYVGYALALGFGTQALILGATVLYGLYAPGVPVKFSVYGWNGVSVSLLLKGLTRNQKG